MTRLDKNPAAHGHHGDDGRFNGAHGNGALATDTATAARPRDKAVSLRDVARLAGVSAATVSMVLNDNPRISAGTHEKVRRVMQRIGYQPNRIAQSLSSRETKTLAVLVPALRHAFADAYFGELISGIYSKASQMGFKVMLEQARPEFIHARKHVELFEQKFVDGVLCLGTNDHDAYLDDFEQVDCPAVVVDNRLGQWPLDWVMCDYKSGAEQAMNYLLQLGHRHVGLIMAAQEISTSRDVRNVYIEKLTVAGHAPSTTQIADGEFTEEGGASAARRILEAHPETTALFCGNDKMAIGAMHMLTRAGVNVPRDMSVVGFDDLRHAAFVNPTLTTIHLPLHEVGARAAERLVNKARGQNDRVRDVLKTHLVVRDSTAMARQHEIDLVDDEERLYG